ncbi:hypothetical protein JAAARDRAFT_200529 [Jaapia argillacea MUCL 33604]|uniref:Uncharacterized protein n=1 Tax=Jaapia argillacea MUCL 33604 TaxID=933084 RepID=A0A067PFP1_9AGAM|nr:hypothetical protein JAAARDRAFT_200529 [Jaapia argillacea MUCL 33604]
MTSLFSYDAAFARWLTLSSKAAVLMCQELPHPDFTDGEVYGIWREEAMELYNEMKPLHDSIVSHHAQPPASAIDWSEFITLIQTNDTVRRLILVRERECREAARKAEEDAKQAEEDARRTEEATRKAKAAAWKASVPPPPSSTKDADVGSVSSGSSSRGPPTSGSNQSSAASESDDDVMIINPASDPCVYCISHELACKRPDATPKAPSKVILKLTAKKTRSRESEPSRSVKRPRTESSVTIGPGTSRNRDSSTTTPSFARLDKPRSFEDQAAEFHLGLTYMMDAFNALMEQYWEEMDEVEVGDLFDEPMDVKGKGKGKAK